MSDIGVLVYTAKDTFEAAELIALLEAQGIPGVVLVREDLVWREVEHRFLACMEARIAPSMRRRASLVMPISNPGPNRRLAELAGGDARTGWRAGP